MKLSTLIRFKQELEEIKNSGLTLAQYCKTYNKVYSNINVKIKKAIEVRDLYIKEVDKVLEIYVSLLANPISKRKYLSIIEENCLESPENDSHDTLQSVLCGSTDEHSSLHGGSKISDDTTHVDIIRDDNDRIVKYHAVISIKDSPNLEVDLSRREVEDLYGLYVYYGGNITARNVANEFPRFTLPEVKKLFRAFKLTKDSAWFPPHLNEELTEEELNEYRMNIKERSAFKYANSVQERSWNNKLKEMASKINNLYNKKDIIKELQLEQFNVKPITVEKDHSKSTLIIYLSDLHVGAFNSKYGYEDLVPYNQSNIEERLNVIINKLLVKEYSEIIVCNLGDSIDSYKKETTRGGHELPSITTDKDNVKLYIQLLVQFFTNLKENTNCPISYHCVGESNHDGDFGWLVNTLLASKIKSLGIKSYISDYPMDSFKVNGNIFLYRHGKDNIDQTRGLPLVLNDKVESWYSSYLFNNNIKAEKGIYVVKGDLHQHAITVGKTFTYVSAASLYGASNYIVANFGKTPWGVTYMEVANNGDVLTGLIK